MKTLTEICEIFGISGLVYCYESDTFLCINNKILYNKTTGTITLIG